MALNARHRYILWNAGLWLLLAAAGVVSIGLLRQYGSAVAQQERARALVARADAYYQDGDLASCQGVLVQALTLSPGLLSEVADRFGMRMANLPFTVDGLTAKTSAPVAPASPEALASAQLEIVRGNLGQASRLLDEYTANGGRDPRALLWRGRIALEAADFPKAQREFARYWQAVPDAKANFDKELGGRADGTDPEQRAQDGRTLFWAGLWDDAFAAFTEAAKAGSNDPELDFFQGVALDVSGDTANARALYTKTLTRLPNHLLSLRRLHMLLSGQTPGKTT